MVEIKPKKKYVIHRGFNYPKGKALRSRIKDGEATRDDIKEWVRQDATEEGVSVPPDITRNLLERGIIEEA